jgi:chromosome partitioning protein
MELVGLAEIASLLGATKQVVANWKARKADFPTPIADLKSGPVWSKDAVIKWATDQGIAIADDPKDAGGKKTQGKRRLAKVVAMMNMKGGVGKSTLTSNLGWHAAYEKNLRVLMIDLDPQFNLSQYMLGAKGYEELLDSGAPTIEALFRDSKSGGKPDSLKGVIRPVIHYKDGSLIDIVPANLELAWTMKTAVDRAHVLRDYIDEVRPDYDIILLDCSPTESVLSTAAYLSSDCIFVPVKPEFLSTIGLPLLLRSMNEFQDLHKNETLPELGGIIFNDTSEKVEHNRSREFVRTLAAKHGWHVFKNEISHSDSYPAGARVGKPIFMTDNARSWKKEELNRVGNEFLGRAGL